MRSVKWLVGEDKDLREAASVMFRDSPWASLTWMKDEQDATTTLPCWENKDVQHQQVFETERITESTAEAAAAALKDATGEVTVTFRLLNDDRFPPTLAAIMWQLPQSSVKYWMSAWRDAGEAERGVLEALFRSSLLVIDISHFREAAYNCLGVMPVTKRIAKGTIVGGRGNALARIAQLKRVKFCAASSHRPVVDENDFDQCYKFHMAHELEILVTRNC